MWGGPPQRWSGHTVLQVGGDEAVDGRVEIADRRRHRLGEGEEALAWQDSGQPSSIQGRVRWVAAARTACSATCTGLIASPRSDLLARMVSFSAPFRVQISRVMAR